MKITEKMLLNNYVGLGNFGTKLSIVNNKKIWWEYRYTDQEGSTVCAREKADVITMENDRWGEIEMTEEDHSTIQKIYSDEQKLWGNEI